MLTATQLTSPGFPDLYLRTGWAYPWGALAFPCPLFGLAADFELPSSDLPRTSDFCFCFPLSAFRDVSRFRFSVQLSAFRFSRMSAFQFSFSLCVNNRSRQKAFLYRTRLSTYECDRNLSLRSGSNQALHCPRERKRCLDDGRSRILPLVNSGIESRLWKRRLSGRRRAMEASTPRAPSIVTDANWPGPDPHFDLIPGLKTTAEYGNPAPAPPISAFTSNFSFPLISASAFRFCFIHVHTTAFPPSKDCTFSQVATLPVPVATLGNGLDVLPLVVVMNPLTLKRSIISIPIYHLGLPRCAVRVPVRFSISFSPRLLGRWKLRTCACPRRRFCHYPPG